VPLDSAPSGGIRRPAVSHGRKVHWTLLPATKEELLGLKAVAGKREALELTRAAASTSRVLDELPKARWAHLATHRFRADAEFRSLVQLEEPALEQSRFRVRGERTTITGRNPLVLEGLVLAGANLTRSKDKS